jgi:hypothetical protein
MVNACTSFALEIGAVTAALAGSCGVSERGEQAASADTTIRVTSQAAILINISDRGACALARRMERSSMAPGQKGSRQGIISESGPWQVTEPIRRLPGLTAWRWCDFVVPASDVEGFIMLRKVLLLTALPALALIAASVTADNGHSRRNNRGFAELKATEEVPAVSSPARGRFKATIDEENQTISYELSYDGLQAPALQAHIHLGQRRVNGGISVFLCGNAPTVPPETVPQPPACPLSPATITGELTAANIIGPAAQGIDPTSEMVNEFAALVAMFRQELAYVNVHSERFPGGEIRGQLRFDRRFEQKKSH